MVLHASDIISVVALIISLIPFAYAYFTDTKKYELATDYRKAMLDWHNEAVMILVELKIKTKNKCLNNDEKCNLLSRLSTQIEKGRFYFPNIIKDDFGNDKPHAYRGYRNLLLDLLVFSFNLFEKEDAENYLHHADILQRHFTSLIFEITEPKKFIKETKKHTKKVFTLELSFEDFLSQEPEIIARYI